MSLVDAINDKCWAMLDWLWDRKIPVGAVFEKFNLPPILFPLLVVLLILLLVWIMLPAKPTCGNGICAPNENCGTCPADCGICEAGNVTTSGLIVTVQLSGGVTGPVTVKLLDKDDKVLDDETDRKSTFEFTGQNEQLMRAVAACSNGKESGSRPKQITKDDNTITLTLPDGCFEYITDINNQPLKTSGNIVVKVFDIDTSQPIEGALVTAVRTGDNLAEASAYSEGGTATVNVRSDNFYYLTASKAGYDSSTDKQDKFWIIGGDTVYKVINIKSLGVSAATTGSLRVCASSGSSPLSGGKITVMEVGGSELDSAYLNPSDQGCITFTDLPSGKMVRAAIVSPPAGCVSSGYSDSFTIAPGAQREATLSVSCGQQTAFVRVMVQDRNGRTMTQQVKVTLWNAVTREQILGASPDGSLSLGSNGYTEEVTVPANTLIQAKASGAPLGYVDTISGPGAFRSGEHAPITIFLGEKSRGEFTFLGASIIYTPANPSSPVKVYVQQITYNQTILTEDNSQVSIIINGDEYNATFIEPE